MKLPYSDEKIIEGIKAKDNIVLSYLYSEYKQKVINYVTYNSGTNDEAEDVLQDSIIKVYRVIQKKDFVLKKTFGTYFTSIYRNTWICAVKFKNKQNFTENFPDELTEAESNFFNEYQIEQLQKLIMEQFTLLGENCQKILDMFYYQKKAMAEIAYLMDYKNEQIAKNKKYRCLEYLKGLIKTHPIYKSLTDE